MGEPLRAGRTSKRPALGPLPQEVAGYLAGHHVMSLATAADGDLWAASVFYCFDDTMARLLYYTSPGTRHGRLSQMGGRVAATICDQQRDVTQLAGIQLEGRAHMLDGADAEDARRLFGEAFPEVGADPSPIWELRPSLAVLTDNSRGFGHRVRWPGGRGSQG